VTTQETLTRKERAAGHALARSVLYRLLSQALVYPSQEAISDLRGVDLPQAQEAASEVSAQVVPLLAALREHLECTDLDHLQTEHRRVFSHIMSADCPPCETYYTASQVFQETQELSDIGGFYRAFGLEMADKERLDHISVELDFLHFLTHKEAYALVHHGRAKARLCREAQLKFMRDHLGRWAIPFAQSLDRKAGGGYLECVASLTETFISAEMSFLGAQPEVAVVDRRWRTMAPEDLSCAPDECPLAGTGDSDARES
jgi:DMSO reductase family type II enzyme chaperone